MNFIIKTIIKKVFQKYLNLEEELNVESGHIKLPYGKINHQQINKKLEPFGIQISESIYKNLLISIPITEIVSKPIKISIERFEVLIGKKKKEQKANEEKMQENKVEKKETVESNEKVEIEEEVNKYSKNLPAGKEEVSSGYVKNMVNRLLYNMEILFEKIVIKMEKDEENENKEGLNKYLEDVEFEITNLHLRNSLVLLEANIIKKIFNLQQILIRHKFAELIIQDFNICLDYSNKNFNIMAILGSIFFNIKTIPHDEIQKLLKKTKKTTHSKNEPEQKKTGKEDYGEHKKVKKQTDLDIYIKINQSNLQIENLISFKGEMLEIKYKKLHEIHKNSHSGHETNVEVDFLFKNLYFVHLNEEPFEEKDFIIMRYLPWCTEVKTFSEYEDNILKSASIKFIQNETHRSEFVKPFNFKKNQEEMNSSTSFDDNKEDTLMNDYLRKEIKIHVFYLDVGIDLEVAKRVLEKILKDKELKRLFTILSSKDQKKEKEAINEQIQSHEDKQNNEKVEISTDILVYRLMVNVRLINEFSFKIYGSFKGEHSNNFKSSDLDSLTESSFYGHSAQGATISEHVHSHFGKHTHKKKISNKETLSKLSLPENEKGKGSSSLLESKRNSRIHEHKSSQSHSVEMIRFEFIQLCLECKNYRIIDLGKLELAYRKNTVSFETEIVIGGTSINTEFSIKLIKDIIKLVPLIEREVKIITLGIESFFNVDTLEKEISSSKSLTNEILQKEQNKNLKTSIFVKINELNLKVGSLIKKPQNEIRDRISRRENFAWIIMVEITNILFGTKSLKTFKANFETMIYLTSPQTLHKSSITKVPAEFKVKKNKNEEISILLNNDIQLDLNEDSIQILVKYFGSFGEEIENPVKIIEPHDLADNDCCFIEFYNSLEKDVKIIQTNEYEISEDSINLEEFEEGGKNYHDSSKMEEKISLIDKESCELLFLLNEYCITIEIDHQKSYPISLEFKPVPINNSKYENGKFNFEYEELLRFEDNEKMENKYVLHFLLNSMSKIEKVILKNNVSLMTYGKMMIISHENSQVLAYSNVVLSNLEEKISDEFILNLFRTQHYVSSSKVTHKRDFDVNFEFLLDLNEESKEITLFKGENEENTEKLKISGLLLRSPNSKIENSLYSLYGIYKEKEVNKNEKEASKSSVNRLLESYLYQIKHLQTYYFVELPFLIIENNLACPVQLDIFDKKTQTIKSIRFNPKEKKDIHPDSFQYSENNSTIFDFYNKQFTIKIKLISTKKSSFKESQGIEPEEQVFYESEEHYFNTFFMVEHDFGTLITLKSNQKYQFDKKYIFLKEELMLKTKVLKLESTCRIVNKTNFNFGFKFKRNLGEIGSQVKSPKKVMPSENNLEIKNENLPKYVMIPEEEHNNHIVCGSNSEIDIINQFRQNEILEILFNNMEETKIEVSEETSKESHILILSFNFAQNDKNMSSDLGKNQKYCHLLFRLRLKTVDNHQFIILENFITFKNLSLENVFLSLEPEKTIKQNDEVIFPLPPTINNKFNNRTIVLNNIMEMESIYEELFAFGFSNSSKNIKNPKSNIKEKIEANHEKMETYYYLVVKNEQTKEEEKIALNELLYSKNNLKQVSLGSKGIKLFSLLKDIKNGIIRLFFLEKLFNPNLNYLLFNNSTTKNFLISNDNSEYTHHFVKSTSQKTNIFNDSINESEQETTEKIFIQKNTFSTLSSKDDFELFLCDENGKHLEKSTKNNLEKEGLQMDFHTTGNLQLIDIYEIPKTKEKEGKEQSKEAKISIKTRLINLNVNLYSKLFLNFSISNVSLRLLEDHKVDCLIQDISLKNCLSNEHILRIPEESYFLFEGKTVGEAEDSKFILIKNLFVKCKNIILNLEKDLSYRIISLCKNLLPESTKSEDKLLRKKYFDNEGIRLLFESIEANESLDKLIKYLRQTLFLVKNIYVHEIHLSLSLDLENNNFSNVMVIPQYELVNSFMREKNLLKEIGEYYKTNVLAKLPKLSFVFQNIKNPLNLFRTMMKVSSAWNEKIELKNVFTFDHDEIPENDLQFSLQRWNLIHRKKFAEVDSEIDENRNEAEELLTFLYKNETYFLVSNKSFIVISLNSRNIPKEADEAFVHYQSNSEESLGSKLNKKWFRTYENATMRIMSLKDLEKLKLIRNKKYSELVVQFKGNVTFNICDEYEKCSRLINIINSIVM